MDRKLPVSLPADVVIRAARRQERADIVAMSLALLEEHRHRYGSDVSRTRRTEGHVRRNVAAHQRRGAVLVAERGGRILGFVLLSRARFVLDTSRPVGSLTDVYVVPEARNEGIGSRLVEAGIAWLRAGGYRRVVLNVAAENPARRLYERYGFRTFSESMEVLLDDEPGDPLAGP